MNSASKRKEYMFKRVLMVTGERNVETANSTHTIAIFDMGATKTSAAIVQYSVAKDKDGKNVSTAEVLAVKWDDGAGGLERDSRIAEYLADEFDSSIKTNPRGMAKLLKGAKKAKEILSANTEAPVFVEAVDGDRDFSTTLTRDKLEEMAGDLFSRAAEVLKAAVTASGTLLSLSLSFPSSSLAIIKEPESVDPAFHHVH